MRIGMIQLLVEGGEAERNLQRAEKYIRKAKEAGCALALLPETMDLGWTHPSAYEEAENIPGRRSDFFCALAKELKIWICLGLTEKKADLRYNTALLITEEGEIILTYHKINLLEVEFPYYEVGHLLQVVDTNFGKIGINICADNYLDSVANAHMLARMGAQIILSPSSWTVDHSITEEMDPYQDKWMKPLSTIAKIYEIPVVAVTSVGQIHGGPYEGKKMVGCSLALNEDGIITQGEFNEFASDLKVVDINIPKSKRKGTEFGKMIKNRGYENEQL